MNTNHATMQKRSSQIMKLSYLFCGLAIAICPLTLIRYRPQLEVTQGHRYAWLPATIGLMLCTIILVRFRKHVGKPVVAKATICAIVNLILVYGSFQHLKMGFATAMVCGANMSKLGSAINLYAQDNNGIYPDANSWCDELLKAGKVEPATFLCMPDYKLSYMACDIVSYPRPGKGRCHYAVNINCKHDSNPDTVLLFETSIGWNKHGGTELVTLDNHSRLGFNVVYNDGRVMLEKDPLELNWGN